MIPGLIVLIRAPALGPADRFGHDPQRVASLGELVGVQRVGDLVGLQHRQREQLLGRCGRQRGVLLGGEGAEPVPGLGGDDDAGAAGGDDVAELLEDHRGAVQVDVEDRRRRRLARRDAGGVDEAGDVAEGGGGLDEGLDRRAGGDVDGRGADREPGVTEDLRGGVGVRLVEVGEHDVLAGADPPGDGLADRAGADDDDDVAHDVLLAVLLVSRGTRRMVTSAASGPTTVPTIRGP